MVNYNNFAKTFAKSRKNMKWWEIDYFTWKYLWESAIKILDIWCGTARLLSQISNKINIEKIDYTWVDLSKELLLEAQKIFPEKKFFNLNMINIDEIKEKFDNIFFIASFHHLNSIEQRDLVLKKAKNLLKENWKIFMTNWALNSPLNEQKYKNSQIKNSLNNFWSVDYNIKIWKFIRFYHCFSLEELEFLAKKNNFKILENRLFDNQKNFITILEK